MAVVDNADEVPILSNAIYANHGLGIDLNDDGVTRLPSPASNVLSRRDMSGARHPGTPSA